VIYRLDNVEMRMEEGVKNVEREKVLVKYTDGTTRILGGGSLRGVLSR